MWKILAASTVGLLIVGIGGAAWYWEYQQATNFPKVVMADNSNGATLLDAFRVAFGQSAPYEYTDGQGNKINFSPAALIELSPELLALISNGQAVETCHACYGTLAIHYLKREGNGFSRLGSWIGIVGAAPNGGTAPWTIRTDIDTYPDFVTTVEDGGMGCDDTRSEIVELTPTGAFLRAKDLVIDAEYEPDEGDTKNKPYKIVGKLVPILKGHKFAIQFSGTRTFRQTYEIEGGTCLPNGL